MTFLLLETWNSRRRIDYIHALIDTQNSSCAWSVEDHIDSVENINYSVVLRQVHSLFQGEFSIVQSSAYSFNLQYPFFGCLRLVPRLPVTTNLSSIFSSMMCCRRRFLRKMWPTQLAFLLFTVCRIFLSLTTKRRIFFACSWFLTVDWKTESRHKHTNNCKPNGAGNIISLQQINLQLFYDFMMLD
jgi:hypothetical protein